MTIVTSGHPSTCPRMVKAADAAAGAGHDVRFVSVDYIPWATALDRSLVAQRPWRWSPIQLGRADHPLLSRAVSARQRLSRAAAAGIGAERAPRGVLFRAHARTHPELVAAILAEPFDLVYGGTVGALAATAVAGRCAGRPFALDLEDFHPEESEEADAGLTHAVARQVVSDVLRGAAFATTASTPMAAAYASQFTTIPIVVNNVVPRAPAMPVRSSACEPLKLYWFSQVIGPRRGLEDVVRGIAAAAIPVELHLRGWPRADYIEQLRALARRERANLAIAVHQPGPPDGMVDLCAPFDIGLSPEQEGVLNHVLCLGNKPLTYLAAGLAVIATDTPGQRTLQEAAGEGIWWYRPGDIARLAEGLTRWHRDRDALDRARRCSYRAAFERFHWEHALERGALLQAIDRALS